MFSRAAAIGKYRKDVPLAAWAAAAITAVRHEDCGPCTQLGVSMAERAAFLAGAVRKGWTDDLTLRVDTINGLPGLIVSGRHGLVQTTAFEIEGDVVNTIYIVRNPDKLRHLASFERS